MKHIMVVQEHYGPDVYRDVGEDYKVTVTDGGALRVEVSGLLRIYNATVWHSVEIYPEAEQ